MCKIGDKLRQGKYCPYNRTADGCYYSKIKLRDGKIAVMQQDLSSYEALKGSATDVELNEVLVATEIYCNGTIETCEDDANIQFHRYCRPKLRICTP